METFNYIQIAASLEVKKLIKDWGNNDVNAFLLKYHNLPYAKIVAAQLEGKRKSANKFPVWASLENWVFPPMISVEQASSQKTAQYKAAWFKDKIVADITGGMGIDALHFAQTAHKVFYVERDSLLCEICKHNISVLGLTNVEVINEDGLKFITDLTSPIDIIYADPARRKEGKKVVSYADCEPNVLDITSLAKDKCTQIIIKNSPMIDIAEAIAIGNQYFVNEVVVLAAQNECKELIVIASPNKSEDLHIKAVSLKNDDSIEEFDFDYSKEKNAETNYSLPQQYLYEPHAGLMKAGPYKLIANHWKLNKLHPHSHLYTSEKLVHDFHGRIFKIETVIPFNKKSLALLNVKKANIACRNFTLTPEELKKKLKINDGGDCYIFATTLMNKEQVLIKTVKV